jgi:hypothetical protein
MRLSGKLLLGSMLLLATHAFAGVSLPTDGFGCGLYTTLYFGSAVLSDCTATGSATPADGGYTLTGVNLGMSVPVVWDVKGSDAGGTQIAIPNSGGSENQGGSLVMETSGIVGGSGTFTGYLPLHYFFSITPIGSPTCATSNPCTVDISWTLSFLLNGSAVKGGELALPIISGEGTGDFSGDRLLPSSLNPLISVPPMTLTAGESIKVRGILNLNATFPSDASASYSVIVPNSGSFDFQSANSSEVPEPATVTCFAAGLLLVACRRITSRS